MADGKVSISAVLDTKQADEAANAFKEKIMSIGTIMTTATDNAMKQIDSKLKDLERVNKQSTKTTTTNTATTKELNEQAKLVTAQNKVTKALDSQEIQAKKTALALQKIDSQQVNITNSSTKAKGTIANLGQSFQNLTNRIIAYGVISAIQNFGRQVVEVTGQFEQTRIALGAIIGDMEEAQRQFDVIQQQALQSPFSIMELTDTTKMLAAYGFEANELNSTMNMMADLAAGVGVEMSRLAYNMGQIRAQTVLNNRDARDFASAGIPILGQLAEKYSELEGRLVTTGEVFDMVSARMVSAADVQEVLNNMTSEGGMFYQMQAQLADSLRGKISNLTDAYQIMYNEIGQSGYSVLRGGVEVLTELIKNWEIVAEVIGGVVVALGAYGVAALATASKTAILALKIDIDTLAKQKNTVATLANAQAQSLLGKAIVAVAKNPWTAFAAAALSIGYAIWRAYENTEKLNNELKKIHSEGENEINRSITMFDKLTDTINDSSASATEQKEAYEQLKDVFGDILPSQALEIDNLKNQKDGYNALTAAIRDNIETRTLEKALGKVREEYAEDIADETNSLIKALVSGSGFYSGEVALNTSEANRVVSAFNQAINEGRVSADNYRAVLAGIIEEQTGMYRSILGYNNSTVFSSLKLLRVTEQMNLKLRETQNIFAKSDVSLARYSDLWHEATKASEEYTKQQTENRNQLIANNEPVISEFEFKGDVAEGQMQQYVNALQTVFDKEGIDFTVDADMDINDQEIKTKIASLDESNRVLVQSSLNEFAKYQQELVPSTLVASMTDNISNFAKEVGVNMDDVSRFIIGNTQDWETWSKGILASEESIKNITKQLQTKIDTGDLDPTLDDRIAKYNYQLSVLEKMIELYGLRDKKSTAGINDEINALKSQIDTINKVREAYSDLYESSGDASEAAKQVQEVFGESFAETFEGTDIKLEDIITFNDDEIVDKLNQLQNELTSLESKQYIVKIIQDYEVKIKTNADQATYEAMQSELDKLLKNFELSVAVNEAGDFGNVIASMYEGVDDIELDINFKDFTTRAKDIIKPLQDELNNLTFDDVDFGSFDAKKLGIDEVIKGYDNIIKELTRASTDESLTEAQRSAALEALAGLEKSQKERVDIVKEGNELVRKEEEKYNKQRIEYYNSLLEKEGTYEERRNEIIRKAIEDRAKIEQDTDISSTQKVTLTTAVTQRQTSDITQVNLEELQNSRLWLQALGDMEDIATVSIDNMIDLLNEFIATNKELAPTEIKQITDQIRELEDIKIDRNPFVSLKENADAYRESLELVKNAQTQLSFQESVLEDIERMSPDDTALIIEQDKAVAKAKEELTIATNNAQRAQNRYVYTITSSANEMLDFGKSMVGVVGDVDALVTALGGDMSEALEDVSGIMNAVISGAEGIINAILDTVTGTAGAMIATSAVAAQAISSVEKASVILAIISAALQIATAIANVIPSKNKAITDSIEESQYAVDRLSQSYSQLEREVETSLGSAEIAAKRLLIANKELQQSELEKQLALAQSRSGKKYDQEEIDSIKDQLVEVNNDIEDLTLGITNDIFGSVKDIATTVAETWLEMYRNGEDALQGIRDSFKDTMQQMIVDAVLAQAIEAEVAKIWKGVESALEDNVISSSEWGNINKDIEEGSLRMDEILRKLAETYGIAFGEDIDSDGGSSELQRGIQSITEETGLALEGYLATMMSQIFLITSKMGLSETKNDALLAVNNQMLFEIRQGNITRLAILNAIKGMRSEDGRSLRVALQA